MNIAEPFVRRPVMTGLVMLSILIFGLVAYRALPVSDLPNVDFPTVQVSANLPGASAETMASAVATPLQKQFSTLAARGVGIDEVQQAVARHNVNLPTGTLYGQQRAYAVEASGQLTNAAAYRPLIVAYRNGAPIRLGELGLVIDSVQTDKVAAWYQ